MPNVAEQVYLTFAFPQLMICGASFWTIKGWFTRKAYSSAARIDQLARHIVAAVEKEAVWRQFSKSGLSLTRKQRFTRPLLFGSWLSTWQTYLNCSCRAWPFSVPTAELQFNLITLLSDYDTIMQRNIVEHINWVLSELSVGVHKEVNRIGCMCISLLSRTHRFSCILYEVWVAARFDVLFKLLNLKKTINCKVRYIYIARHGT